VNIPCGLVGLLEENCANSSENSSFGFVFNSICHKGDSVGPILWTLQRSVEAGKNQDRGLSNLTYTSVNVVVTLTIRCVEIPNISSRNLNLSQRGHYQISQT
jgi:hypothetical protein